MEYLPVTRAPTSISTVETESPSQSGPETTRSRSSEPEDAALNLEYETSPRYCYLCLNRQVIQCSSCLGNWGHWTPCGNCCSLGFVRGLYCETQCQICLSSPRPGCIPIITCLAKGCVWGFVKCTHVCLNCKGKRHIRCPKCDGNFMRCPTCKWVSRQDVSGNVTVWPQRCEPCILRQNTSVVKPSECPECSPRQGYILCPECNVKLN
jgi:hypothetical protein